MKTLVIGLGNPILGDDGIGWHVVDEVRRRLENGDCKCHSQEIEIDKVSLGGISLMERLVGADRAILVDAIQTPDGTPGSIYRLTLDDLPTFNSNAVHDASLKTALDLGRSLDADLPSEIVIYGIEAVDLWDFSESLSPPVKASVIPAAQAILNALEE
jgi:hydrogenase maturation protease